MHWKRLLEYRNRTASLKPERLHSGSVMFAKLSACLHGRGSARVPTNDQDTLREVGCSAHTLTCYHDVFQEAALIPIRTVLVLAACAIRLSRTATRLSLIHI